MREAPQTPQWARQIDDLFEKAKQEKSIKTIRYDSIVVPYLLINSADLPAEQSYQRGAFAVYEPEVLEKVQLLYSFGNRDLLKSALISGSIIICIIEDQVPEEFRRPCVIHEYEEIVRGSHQRAHEIEFLIVESNGANFAKRYKEWYENTKNS